MTFDEFCDRDAHQREISSTRVGFLGGSDAKMIAHATEVGVEGLSKTELIRLRVCFDCEAQRDWGGNMFTKAGHDFEDYVATQLPYIIPTPIEREKVMHGKQYTHFATLAHADYYSDGVVYECKCVAKKTTAHVYNSYYAQLQWYYLLGAQQVFLVHGNSPDEITQILLVERNDGFIAQLEEGCRLIDEAYEYICNADTMPISVAAQECSMEIQGLLQQYADLQAQVKEIEAKQNGIKTRIANYMRDNVLNAISGGAVNVQYNKEQVVRTLDKKKVLAAYPDIANGDFYDIKNRAASVTITLPKNKVAAVSVS